MSPAPVWWTLADSAELDVLIWELVEAGAAHQTCRRCQELPPGFSCKPLGDAIEAVLDWRRGRALLSRAEFLRRLQDRVGRELVAERYGA